MIFRESPWGKTRHLIKAWSMEGGKNEKNKQTTTPLSMACEQALRPLVPHVSKSWFQNPGTFCLWNPESGNFYLWNSESSALESEIQLKESGIPLTIVIQNPSSTGKDWNPVSGIQNPQRPCWIFKSKSRVRDGGKERGWGAGGGRASWLVFWSLAFVVICDILTQLTPETHTWNMLSSRDQRQPFRSYIPNLKPKSLPER